jgi:RNA polymerase sigma-70 factor (ECF subfamily)
MGQALSLRANLARSPAPLSFPALSISIHYPLKIEMEERIMAKINLRDYYPFYNSDFFIEIPDEIESALLEAERLEKNYIRRRFYNKAHYSLDADDGIEKDILFVSLSPCEIYERKITAEQLHSAIASLPDKQGKRIYAHYILGMSKSDIARAENINEKAVREAIERGLKNMEKFLKKI